MATDHAETVREQWGMACPACDDDSHLMLTVLASAMLSAGGTEVYGDHEWTDESPCECTVCQWRGTVADARAATAEREGLSRGQVHL